MKQYKKLAVKIITFPEDAIRTSGDESTDDDELWTGFY